MDSKRKNLNYTGLLILIFSGFMLFSCGESSFDSNAIRNLIDEGEFSQAEAFIHKVLEEDSSNVEANVLYADLLLKKGSYKEAFYFLNKAHGFDSTSVEVNLKLSEFHLYLGQFEKAIASANNVLKKERTNAKAYFLKGLSYKEFGDTTKAFSNFQTSSEQDPNYYEVFVQLGILSASKHDSAALQYFDHALSLKPSSPEVLFNKALFYQQNGAPNKAFNIYITIPEGSNFYGRAIYNSGNILYEQGNLVQASQLFDIAAQYNNPKAYYMKGLIYEREGKLDSAKWNYEQCLRLNGEFELAKERMSKLK